MQSKSQSSLMKNFFRVTDKNRKWWILAAMTSSVSMIFVDVTVLPVTLPTIQRELNISDLGLQWIINAYLLTLSALVLAGGRLGDMFGHRRNFCWGLLLFSIASALCGLSLSGWWFIGSRALQGVGAALLLPSSSALLLNAFPAHERGRALGLYISVGSVFLVLGPLIGGIFTQYLSWRYVFWINLPIALIGLALTFFSVPKSEKIREAFDFLGFFTISLGISAIVVSLMQAERWGWTSPLTLGLLLAGIACIVLLMLFDRDVETPFFDFKLFKNREFTSGLFCIFCNQFLVMVTVYWAIYFQTILGYSPAGSGSLALVANLPVIIAAPLSGYLVDRLGAKIPVTVGFCSIAFSLLMLNWFANTLRFELLVFSLITFGGGVSLIFTPSFAIALRDMAAQKRGVASATITAIRQFSSTLGIAIMGALFLNLQKDRFSYLLKQDPDTLHLRPSKFDGLLAQAPDAIEALRKLSEGVAQKVQAAFEAAYVRAFEAVNMVGVVVALIGLLFGLFFLKNRQKTHNQ